MNLRVAMVTMGLSAIVIAALFWRDAERRDWAESEGTRAAERCLAPRGADRGVAGRASPTGRVEDPNSATQRKQNIGPLVRRLASPGDSQAAVARLVDEFRRNVRSAENSSAQLTQEGGRYHVLAPLLQGAANFSILMNDGLPTPRDSWTILTRVETMLNGDFVTEADKVTIAREFLDAMGTSPDAPLDSYGLSELYGEFMDVREAIYEARQLRLLVGKSFTEAQARETARAIRGWSAGQARLLLLHEYLRRRSEQNDAENAELEAAAQRIADEKRQAMRRILTPEQFDDLYIKKSYDSLGFWQARQKSQR